MRRAFSYSAWGMIIAIIVGFATAIPGIGERLESTLTPGTVRTVAGTLILVVFCNALVLWIAAMTYAWKESSSRATTIALLLFTNFVGAFFYYFIVASRMKNAPTVPRQQ